MSILRGKEMRNLSFKGEIRWTGMVSNSDGEQFYSQIKDHIANSCSGLYTEIQYHPVVLLDGKIVFTAFVIGREPKTLE
jgi:hypothetical protein